MSPIISEQLIIDKAQGLKLAGGRQDLADEILGMLVERLKPDLKKINELSAKNDYAGLRNEVHKLHGAVCYCGLPRLKAALMNIESDLKNNIMTDLPQLLDRLNDEVALVLEHYTSDRATA